MKRTIIVPDTNFLVDYPKCTTEKLRAELPRLGNPAVSIDKLEVDFGRLKHDESGIAVLTTVTPTDLKSVPLTVGVALFKHEGDSSPLPKSLTASAAFAPEQAQWIERNLGLFVPYAKLGRLRGRYGMHRVRFTVGGVAACAPEKPKLLALANDRKFVLTGALREWTCPDLLLRHAA